MQQEDENRDFSTDSEKEHYRGRRGYILLYIGIFAVFCTKDAYRRRPNDAVRGSLNKLAEWQAARGGERHVPSIIDAPMLLKRWACCFLRDKTAALLAVFAAF